MSAQTVLRALKALDEPMTVDGLAAKTQYSMTAIRQLLALLNEEGFVRPEGTTDTGGRGPKPTLWRRIRGVYAETKP